MNRLTLDEIKQYIGLDGDENDKILAAMLTSAEHLVKKILRVPIIDNSSEIVKNAVLFTVWQLYFHRDHKDFDSVKLELTLAVMLSDLRKKEF